MPRVIVIIDARERSNTVLLDEQVNSVHLDTEHSAWQFIERLGWAISDAEDLERAPAKADEKWANPREIPARPRRGRSRSPAARAVRSGASALA